MTQTDASASAGGRKGPGRPPFVAIGALARLIIEARCAVHPDETPKLVRSVELYATGSNNLPVPLPAQGARPQMTGHIGRWHSSIGDEFFHGHIDRGPFLIGEGRITISEDTIPRSAWNALVSGRRDGDPISTIVDLGPGHDAPIEDVTLVKDSSVERAVITFDNRPMRWSAFKADLLARHQTGGPFHDPDMRLRPLLHPRLLRSETGRDP